MKSQGNKGSAGTVATIVIFLMVVAIVMANRWLQKQTSGIGSEPADAPVAVTVPQKKKAAVKVKKGTGEVIRKARLSADRKHEISILYQGGVEIAKYKVTHGRVYDQEGEIPDGKVKFINKSNEAYGVEYYKNGKRHGPAKIFYSDDQLRQELYYQYGALMTNVEYYHDGTVRMEEDYSDARAPMENSEVGVGKVYTRHGTLKYEWFMVNSEPVGFKKSYDQKGRLVDEVYFNEYGQVIEPKKALQGVAADASRDDIPVSGGMPPNASLPPVAPRQPKQIFVPAG